MHRRHQIEQRQGQRVIRRHYRECEGNARIDGVGEHGDATSVVSVGHPPGDRRQDSERNELRETKQAELERRLFDTHPVIGAGDIVELIAENDDDPGRREYRRKTRNPEQAIIAIGEWMRKGRERLSHGIVLGALRALVQPFATIRVE